MEFTIANYQSIANSMIAEWTQRSRTTMVASKGPGCFIWNSKTDGIQGSGMFYTKDMVPQYFSGVMAEELQQMIEQANHSEEIVVALLLD